MQVIGNGGVHIFEDEDNRPHAPGGEELWQESLVLYLWDTESEVYVFLRIGQTPNREGGTATAWLNVWTPEHIYKYTDDSIPFDGQGRTDNSLSIGDGLCSYLYDGKHNWKLEDTDVSVDLVMEDYHPGVGFFPKTAQTLINDVAKNHMEATGWVTGAVTLKGKTYQVAGTGWRDHSWGVRNWLSIRVHRFFPAMFGKDLNVFCISFLGEDGKFVKYGVVIRDDTVEFIDDFSITAYMSEDGISNRGGRVELALDGEERILEYEPIGKCAVSMIHNFPCVDGMCIVRMGDRVGVGVSETSERAQGGSEIPKVFPDTAGVIENGIFER